MRARCALVGLIALIAAHPVMAQPLTSFVDPFIGTGGHCHTYPGPSVPFGMIQPGPDTRLTGWDGCSGYHYTDSRLYGFWNSLPTALHSGKPQNEASAGGNPFDDAYASAWYRRRVLPVHVRRALTNAV